MKIHPLFKKIVFPFDDSGHNWVGYTFADTEAWLDANCPVVELESSDPVLYSAKCQLERANKDLAAAKAEIKTLGDDVHRAANANYALHEQRKALDTLLAAANARIKELEEKKATTYDDVARVAMQRWGESLAKGNESYQNAIRNAALEEAASLIERESSHPLGYSSRDAMVDIRAMKKGGA